jgi:hypothetical protein
MPIYIGTKALRTKPMTRGDYNAFRGWQMPADKDPNEAGYLVEYLDGGKPNVEGFDGYVSWSPAVFEKSYRPIAGMTFGDALTALKIGNRVARAGWNGKGMFLVLVPGSSFPVTADRPFGKAAPELVGQTVEYRSHIDMFTVDRQFVPWVASQTDMLADDWEIVG